MSLFLFKLAYHNAFFALCQVIHEWLFEFWMLAQKFQKTNGIVLKEQITWKKKSNQDFGNALPLHGGAIAASIARMEVGTWKQRFPRP